MSVDFVNTVPIDYRVVQFIFYKGFYMIISFTIHIWQALITTSLAIKRDNYLPYCRLVSSHAMAQLCFFFLV